MAEMNPFETNTLDIWAQFEADETQRTDKFDDLHQQVTAHHMDTPFRPRELWTFPTNVGWVRILGYVKQLKGHQPVEHLVVNIEQGDSTDYDGRDVEVGDYFIDFKISQLAKNVTEVRLATSRQSTEEPCIDSSSGPVIEYRNLNCEVTCGVAYNEAFQNPQFGDSNIHEIDEIIALLAKATQPDAVAMYHEAVTRGR